MTPWLDPGDHIAHPHTRKRRAKYLDTTLPLFTIGSDYQVTDRPIARNSDPHTSHVSAHQLTASGKLGAQMRETLDALRRHVERTGESPTSAELAGAADVHARFRHARRLADLRERGLVMNGDARVCRVTGRLALTWEVVP